MSISNCDPEGFSVRLLNWYECHGRKQLPWQQQVSAYRVWVSEIMLQQTQVATVIPYYRRFMTNFPNVEALAAAEEESVLHHWQGLGYYARARNLHKSARIIVDRWGGRFPDRLEEAMSLPGIGRSTAGAILSLALGQHHAILDGNVKRVLCRVFRVSGWPGKRAVERRLWELSEQLTPAEDAGRYNQAMMDLGATLCSRRRPRCDECPLMDCCLAYHQGDMEFFPEPRPKQKRPLKQANLIIVEDGQQHWLLEKRPPTGVWGGLWSFPEVADDKAMMDWLSQSLQIKPPSIVGSGIQQHQFSHYDLKLNVYCIHFKEQGCRVLDGDRWVWYKPGKAEQRALAAPVIQWLRQLEEEKI